MSRTFMSTGEISLSDAMETNKRNKEGTEVDSSIMKILLMANLSGESQSKRLPLKQRKPIEVDYDNFEEVFSQLDVSLKLPLADEAIHFREFDDLHPDFIYERVDQFSKLRALKRKLQKPEKFHEAANEIRHWASYEQADTAVSESETIYDEQSADFLSGLLESANKKAEKLSENTIDGLIKEIVAPYIEPQQDPELASLNEAVDLATADLLRSIMHASKFQQLESSWRCVDLILRRVELGRKIKLYIWDVDVDELKSDYSSIDTYEQSTLFKLLEQNDSVSGASPFNFLVCDYKFRTETDDIKLLNSLAHTSAHYGVSLAGAAEEKFAGCEDIFASADEEDWQLIADEDNDEVNSAWMQLRQSEAAAFVNLSCPDFLVRLPYGKRSKPIESFAFEELGAQADPQYYLWGNSAYLVTVMMAQAYQKSAWGLTPGQVQSVEQLPIHVYQDDGEQCITPPAKVYLNDRSANKLADVGLTSIRSIKNKDAILVSLFRSLSLQGRWRGYWR